MSNTVAGVVGPGFQQKEPGEIQIDFPDCIKIETKADGEALKAFVAKIVESSNQNCLNLIADFVAKQNEAIQILVRKLGVK